MSGDRVTTLADRIAHLHALALLDPKGSALQVAIIDMLEELAEQMTFLNAHLGVDPKEPPNLGSI